MSSLFQAVLNITAIGMGVVFVLLTLLVGIIRSMSAICAYMTGDSDDLGSGGSAATGPDEASEIAGVISAAISSHRKRHRR